MATEKAQMSLSDFEAEMFDLHGATETRNIMIYGDSGAGKGHPYGTLIMSPSGWLKIEDLEPGTVITGSDGKPQKVIAVYDRGILDAYRVTFDDGASVITDGSHLWRVSEINHMDRSFLLTTEDLLKRERKSRLNIPLVAPVEHDGKVPLDPYLMGVLLANGHFEAGTPVITTNEQSIMDAVIARNPRLDISEVPRPEGAARAWRWRQGAKHLRALGLWEVKSRDKFIPSQYFTASIADRKALLAGLIDCDGTVRLSNGQPSYCTRSEGLAEGVRALVESLGGTGNIICSNGIDYSVSIYLPFNPFTLKRKADKWRGAAKRRWLLRRRFTDVEHVGKMAIRCIAVSNPDRLYVTERHIVTHNTVLAGTLPGNILFLAGEPGYISAARQGSKGRVRITPDTSTALAAINWLEAGNFTKFDWVVIDGLSTLQNKFLLCYAAEAFDANPAKRAHRNLPDKPDYFNAQNFVKSWIARFVDLPVNVLITAHTMRTENNDGELLVLPGIQGKVYEVSNYVSGLMHSVGYMSQRMITEEKGKPGRLVRRILWQTAIKDDVRYFAKDQFDALGVYTDDLGMPDLLELIDKKDAALGINSSSGQSAAAKTRRTTRR